MSAGQDDGTLNEFEECSYVRPKDIYFRLFIEYLSHIKAHKICNSEEKRDPRDEQI
jgi:hypothetical protein